MNPNQVNNQTYLKTKSLGSYILGGTKWGILYGTLFAIGRFLYYLVFHNTFDFSDLLGFWLFAIVFCLILGNLVATIQWARSKHQTKG